MCMVCVNTQWVLERFAAATTDLKREVPNQLDFPAS